MTDSIQAVWKMRSLFTIDQWTRFKFTLCKVCFLVTESTNILHVLLNRDRFLFHCDWSAVTFSSSITIGLQSSLHCHYVPSVQNTFSTKHIPWENYMSPISVKRFVFVANLKWRAIITNEDIKVVLLSKWRKG